MRPNSLKTRRGHSLVLATSREYNFCIIDFYIPCQPEYSIFPYSLLTLSPKS